ncbi:hypothetical protein NITLEN_80025 [Nitrospira lenta]|uniref:Uncharacterized protein n=1 Tax=Nitrospira lenta TaxID=1436998 RepID=A0A330LA63_9BACT|nr:hypothetical protein NITLEN_80025 [Nitrospira lenta]
MYPAPSKDTTPEWAQEADKKSLDGLGGSSERYPYIRRTFYL